MSDMPVVPGATSVPAVPVAPETAAPKADLQSKVDATKAPVDKAAADKVKTDTAAEKAVIQKIKVGDNEYDETTLKSMIEKAKGADKKFLEAAQTRKEAMRFFKLAKENPREFLRQTGLDPKQFSYDEVAKDIQDKLRDPKDVELENAQKRLKEFEEKEAVEKKRVQDEKLTRQAKALEEKFNAQAIKALENHPAIPKNGFSVSKMAKYIEVVHSKTGEYLSFEDVASVIENDIRSEVKGVFTGATAEQIIELIGEQGMAAIRAYDIAKLKDPLKGGNPPSKERSDREERQPKNSKEVWKEIDQAAKREGYNRFGQKVN